MPTNEEERPLVVFDIGGTWFRSGLFERNRGLYDCQRTSAINYLTHPALTAAELQQALAEFILNRTRQIRENLSRAPRTVSISLGAPVNAHDMIALGSGPLWGPTAQPFHLQAYLKDAEPDFEWQVINDVTALLSAYMEGGNSNRKTMLVTISSGIGSRTYDHRTRRIPYDSKHGVQGEIGHLPCTFEIDEACINRRCECGGWNHTNAFSSGRGIAQTLLELPVLHSGFQRMFGIPRAAWEQESEEFRLSTFQRELHRQNELAACLLEIMVSPVSRTLATALCLDPEIDRIVLTGGVVRGLGKQYREALGRVFLREGLYQITEREPTYLESRLRWDDTDDFSGLRGAGIYAALNRARHTDDTSN